MASGFGGAGALTALAGSGLDFVGGLLQKKPTIPDFVPTSAQASQVQATAGNQANLDATEKLASDVNSFNQDQLLSQIRKAIPGYDAMVSKSGSDITSFLKGEIPQDVSDLVNRSTAARAVSGGYGGSGLADNLTARDLGTTSTNLISQGLDAASRWITTQRQSVDPALFDVSSMFISPAQQIGITQSNNSGTFQQHYARNLNDAAHDTATIAGGSLMKLGDSLMGSGASAAGGSAGGGGSSVTSGIDFSTLFG